MRVKLRKAKLPLPFFFTFAVGERQEARGEPFTVHPAQKYHARRQERLQGTA